MSEDKLDKLEAEVQTVIGKLQTFEVKLAVQAENKTYMEGRFNRIEASQQQLQRDLRAQIDEVKGTITWIARLIIGAVILAAIGGLMVAGGGPG